MLVHLINRLAIGMYLRYLTCIPCFRKPTSFDHPIGDWDVSCKTSRIWRISSWKLGCASAFNQPIGDWNVSSVTKWNRCFCESSFDQEIGDWNVSNVSSMYSMFEGALSFNQAIGDWNVSKC